MAIYEIPGTLVAEWREDVKAMIDKWENYNLSLEQFREAVDAEIAYAKERGVKAWIVDSSEAKGAISQNIQNALINENFEKLAKAGVKHFVTIPSDVSVVSKLSINSVVSKAGPHGIETVEVASVEDAVEWLKQNA